MKKILASLLVSLTIPSLVFAFSDVSTNSKYLTSITELNTRGVLQGYEDGTFKPNQPINRAEFLKIIIEGLNFETNENISLPFSDIPQDAWYKKYIQTAFNNGWVQGYEDGTYRPSSNINKVEALKILALAQNWDLDKSLEEAPFEDINSDAWYINYINFAYSKNFLEETNGNFIPSKLITRAEFSEIIFRNIITEEKQADSYSKSLLENNETVIEEEQTDNTEDNNTTTNNLTNTISTNYFNDTVLSENFPKTIYKNEYYTIKGNTNRTESSAYFIIAQNNQIIETYSGAIKNGEFTIPIYFKKTGSYQISIAYDNEPLKLADIEVLNTDIPTTTDSSSTTPTNLDISFDNNETLLTWNNETDNSTFITFNQGTKNLEFILRQDSESFSIPYPYFEDFSKGSTTVKIETCKNTSTTTYSISSTCHEKTLDFYATYHNFSIISDVTNLQNLKETYSTNEDLNFSAKTLADIQDSAIILTPSNTIIEVELNGNITDGTIEKNNNFSLNLENLEKGIYILEINNTDGTATINTPLYVGNIIPLIPDFYDLNRNNSETENITSLTTSRSYFLDLVNEVRNQYGLNNVSLDTELNTLAQNHAEDMYEKDYIGHINLEDQSPDDRRLEANIKTPVGENISYAPTIDFSHFGLIRSPIHLKNILDPRWEKVGIGIKQDENGYIYSVQEFSNEPYTSSDLNNIENYLENLINDSRSDNAVQELSTDSSYEEASNNWSQLMVDEDFLGFSSTNGTEISEVLQDANVTGNVQVFVSQEYNYFNIVKSINAVSEILTSASSTKIGVGVKMNQSTGLLKVTIIYNE